MELATKFKIVAAAKREIAKPACVKFDEPYPIMGHTFIRIWQSSPLSPFHFK
jgi:hypothetical protein